MTYSIQLMQKIVNYLVSKPWAEVNGLLAEIQQEELADKARQDTTAKPETTESSVP